VEITSDQLRFRSLRLALESRLFIGLSTGGMLETGCVISHSYGMPYIPGSSIKGAVTSYVRAADFGCAHPEVARDFFGCEPRKEFSEGLAGVFTFHDAWWVPGSAKRPMVQEVVTSHHLDYYTAARAGRRQWTWTAPSPVPQAPRQACANTTVYGSAGIIGRPSSGRGRLPQHRGQPMTTYFVTRHPGARDWAAEEGFPVDRVAHHLDPARIEPGDRVIGSLPVNLAAEVCERGGAYLHLTLVLPPELRGCELSAAQMRAHGARIEQYSVRRLPLVPEPNP
jgi:CRISPR-associated protein Csx16